MRNTYVRNIALCAVLASVAIVIMFLGGLIPFATYICPVLCIMLGNIVILICGVKFGWLWYVTVSLLSIMVAPDREAAVVYVFLGMYPCIKLIFERLPLPWVWKFMYFNVAAIIATLVSAYILGLSELIIEFYAIGILGLFAALILSNITFMLLDHLLSKITMIKIR